MGLTYVGGKASAPGKKGRGRRVRLLLRRKVVPMRMLLSAARG